jgi:hypothetical protein
VRARKAFLKQTRFMFIFNGGVPPAATSSPTRLNGGGAALPLRPARRMRVHAAAAVIACAGVGGLLPGAQGLHPSGSGLLRRHGSGGRASNDYGSSGVNTGISGMSNSRRRGGPLFVGDFLKGDLYPG